MVRKYLLAVLLVLPQLLAGQDPAHSDSLPQGSDKAHSQEWEFSRCRQGASLGIAGEGLLFSINYDRIVFEREHWFISGGVGVGGPMFLTLPHRISICAGSNRHNLEFGMGGTYAGPNKIIDGGSEGSYLLYPVVGYRHQPQKGVLFRVYINPYINLSSHTNSIYSPFLGTTIGYGF